MVVIHYKNQFFDENAKLRSQCDIYKKNLALSHCDEMLFDNV